MVTICQLSTIHSRTLSLIKLFFIPTYNPELSTERMEMGKQGYRVLEKEGS
jgi:hypothetical protein